MTNPDALTNVLPHPGPGRRPADKVPLIIMVGADKGGVGKTTVARALDDYLQSKGARRRLFDSQWPAGDLKQFAPAAEVVNVDRVDDQMKVFDTVAGVTVLDVCAGLLSPTLRALDQTGLLKDVRSGSLNLALLHVLGPTLTSFNEVAEATAIIGGGARHFIVKNYINESGFFEWDTDGRFTALFESMRSRTVSSPHLPARAAEEVQSLGVSFDAFTQSNKSRILRGYVRDWLDHLWADFDRVGLGDLVARATEGV